MTQQRTTRRGFGNVRQLPSGKFQARYRHRRVWYTAETTFTTQRRAVAELGSIERAIETGRWAPPAKAATPTATPQTFRAYARAWLSERPLATRTREHYDTLLRDHILPTFGELAVPEITPSAVRTWHAGLDTGPTARAHAYSLLRSIMTTAVADELAGANPCRIRGAGTARTAKRPRPATLAELAAIVDATPEQYRAMILLAVWCSLRYGELAELRRSDVDVKAGVVQVRRGVVRTKDGHVVKAPKSDAGRRDVTIPGHILDDVKAHLADHAQPGRDGLLFTDTRGKHLGASSMHVWFYPAREAAGRGPSRKGANDGLRFHDLRHTGQTYAAATGANLRELMARAGQSSPGAALRYLHEVDGRQREIAEQLAGFATSSNVVPIKAAAKSTTRKRKEGGA